MPVRKDASGRRSVQAEAEVPGTPEEVWKAIATGPGISSWFVPTRVDDRVGGTITSEFGPGMEATATLTAWEPPRRFTADSRDAANAPTIATEWTVEARGGGTCVVRVVHAWFADSDDWDTQFEGAEYGWVAFFRILRVYLAHFRGQPGSAFQAMAMTPAAVPEAWHALTAPLGFLGAAEGQHVQSVAGAPPASGIVERVGPPEYPELLLRLDEPAPGIAHLFAMAMGPTVCVPIRFYFFGERAPAAVAEAEPLWQRWLAGRFPADASAAVGGQAGA